MMKLKIKAALYTAGLIMGIYSFVWLLNVVSKMVTAEQMATGAIYLVGAGCIYVVYRIILGTLKMEETLKNLG